MDGMWGCGAVMYGDRGIWGLKRELLERKDGRWEGHRALMRK